MGNPIKTNRTILFGSRCISFPLVCLLILISPVAGLTNEIVFDENLVYFGKHDEKTSIFPESLRISPNGKHLAYLTSTGKGKSVYVDDQTDGHIWKDVGKDSFVFTNDSNHFAYTATDGTNWFAVVDKKKGPAFEKVGYFIFSPDGKYFIYVGRKNKKQYLLLNHKIKDEADSITQPLFSPFSNRIAYVKVEDDKKHVFDSKIKKGKSFPYIRSIKYSINSEHISYIVEDRETQWLVFDHVEKKEYSGKYIGMTVFSRNSARFACSAFDDKNWWIWVDDKKLGPFDKVLMFKFSPDSEHFLFTAGKDGKEILVMDGKILLTVDQADSIEFSKDSKHYACRIKKNGKYMIFTDGKESEKYEDIIGPWYISEKSSLAYVGILDEDEKYMVMDGKRGKAYESVGKPILNQSGTKIAYVGKIGDDSFMVFDGKEYGPYENFRHFGFSEDDRYFVFSAKRTEGRWFAVVNGKELKTEFNTLPVGERVYSEAPNQFYFPVAVYKNDLPWLYRYEVKMK